MVPARARALAALAWRRAAARALSIVPMSWMMAHNLIDAFDPAKLTAEHIDQTARVLTGLAAAARRRQEVEVEYLRALAAIHTDAPGMYTAHTYAVEWMADVLNGELRGRMRAARIVPDVPLGTVYTRVMAEAAVSPEIENALEQFLGVVGLPPHAVARGDAFVPPVFDLWAEAPPPPPAEGGAVLPAPPPRMGGEAGGGGGGEAAASPDEADCASASDSDSETESGALASYEPKLVRTLSFAATAAGTAGVGKTIYLIFQSPALVDLSVPLLIQLSPRATVATLAAYVEGMVGAAPGSVVLHGGATSRYLACTPPADQGIPPAPPADGVGRWTTFHVGFAAGAAASLAGAAEGWDSAPSRHVRGGSPLA